MQRSNFMPSTTIVVPARMSSRQSAHTCSKHGGTPPLPRVLALLPDLIVSVGQPSRCILSVVALPMYFVQSSQPSRCSLCKVTTTKCTEVRSLSSHSPLHSHIRSLFYHFNRHSGEDPGPPHTPLWNPSAADQHAPAKAATSSLAPDPKSYTPPKTVAHPQNSHESR